LSPIEKTIERENLTSINFSGIMNHHYVSNPASWIIDTIPLL
jgi:hypothetical protein